ncbi:MAG: hypothetical protein HY912_23830 [Desulfomonile tiedjei]|uniref:Uncharacterized protein n=1 Tax=Desulfomonile tiedjei TaxID=2358 RepID=A0A9D6V9Q9_9BACT|nr:hypothetical protein [Desulfomonile tiedjei]
MKARIWILIICTVIAFGPGVYGTSLSCPNGAEDSGQAHGKCHCPEGPPCKCQKVPASFYCCTHSGARGSVVTEHQAWKFQPHNDAATTLYSARVPVELVVDILAVAYPEHYGGNRIFLQNSSFRS